jgi:hypothetical protein
MWLLNEAFLVKTQALSQAAGSLYSVQRPPRSAISAVPGDGPLLYASIERMQRGHHKEYRQQEQDAFLDKRNAYYRYRLI